MLKVWHFACGSEDVTQYNITLVSYVHEGTIKAHILF